MTPASESALKPATGAGRLHAGSQLFVTADDELSGAPAPARLWVAATRFVKDGPLDDLKLKPYADTSPSSVNNATPPASAPPRRNRTRWRTRSNAASGPAASGARRNRASRNLANSSAWSLTIVLLCLRWFERQLVRSGARRKAGSSRSLRSTAFELQPRALRGHRTHGEPRPRAASRQVWQASDQPDPGHRPDRLRRAMRIPVQLTRALYARRISVTAHGCGS